MKLSKICSILTLLFSLRLTQSDEKISSSTIEEDNLLKKSDNLSTKHEKTLSESVLKSDLLRNLDLANIFHEASNDIGLPFSLRDNLIQTLRENGMLNLKGASLLLKQAEDASSPRDYGGGGCNDSFAVFGFLAFLLALVDLLIRLGVIMVMTGRKKRGLASWDSQSENENSCQSDYRELALKEGTLASYCLLRGFLNAMDAKDPVCSNRFMCEATMEAAKIGKIGRSFAKVASSNARQWLEHIDSGLHSGTEGAALMGLELETSGNTCQDFFPCSNVPQTYKFPGFKEIH